MLSSALLRTHARDGRLTTVVDMFKRAAVGKLPLATADTKTVGRKQPQSGCRGGAVQACCLWPKICERGVAKRGTVPTTVVRHLLKGCFRDLLGAYTRDVTMTAVCMVCAATTWTHRHHNFC